MNDYPHIKIARSYIGQKEVKGTASNPWIINLWSAIPWIWGTVTRKDDSVLPWCGAFVRHVLKEAKLPQPKKWWSAKSYGEYGVRLNKPIYGCIGVISRTGGGHVGFVVGCDHAGNIALLGGNQNDSVNIAMFSPSRFVAYVMPESLPIINDKLPNIKAELSTSEA